MNVELVLLIALVTLGLVVGLRSFSRDTTTAFQVAAVRLGCAVSGTFCGESDVQARANTARPATVRPFATEEAPRRVEGNSNGDALPTVHHPALTGVNLSGLSAANIAELNALAAEGRPGRTLAMIAGSMRASNATEGQRRSDLGTQVAQNGAAQTANDGSDFWAKAMSQAKSEVPPDWEVLPEVYYYLGPKLGLSPSGVVAWLQEHLKPTRPGPLHFSTPFPVHTNHPSAVFLNVRYLDGGAHETYRVTRDGLEAGSYTYTYPPFYKHIGEDGRPELVAFGRGTVRHNIPDRQRLFRDTIDGQPYDRGSVVNTLWVTGVIPTEPQARRLGEYVSHLENLDPPLPDAFITATVVGYGSVASAVERIPRIDTELKSVTDLAESEKLLKERHNLVGHVNRVYPEHLSGDALEYFTSLYGEYWPLLTKSASSDPLTAAERARLDSLSRTVHLHNMAAAAATRERLEQQY